MLTLTRRQDEVVVIYDRETGEVLATVTVEESKRTQVRLGFSGKETIGFDRIEVYAQRKRGEEFGE